jgi:tRNA-modifying protein YgfZ
MSSFSLPTETVFTSALPESIILLSGADARSFLHNQITQSVTDLKDGEVRWGGYCSAKGRLIATFPLWAQGENVYLCVPNDIASALIKRLSLFVLRAKVKISLMSSNVFGIIHPSSVLWESKDIEWPVHSMSWIFSENGYFCIRFNHSDGYERGFIITLQDKNHFLDKPEFNLNHPFISQAWQWLWGQAGVVRITSEIQEAFVPQMVNFEHIGGINFKKGCYPGQEVVARAQYRGTVKRRMSALELSESVVGLPKLGSEYVQGEHSVQVAFAAEAPNGSVWIWGV